MKVTPSEIPGVQIIELESYEDERGYFLESWNQQKYSKAGIAGPFVQDNLSFSKRDVLRGLHFQRPRAQGKLVTVLDGEVFDVAIDLRPESQSFGKWLGVHLTSTNHLQLYIPGGFAHGFLTISDTALFCYKCTDFYSPESEFTLRWDDKNVGIRWPVNSPIVSQKDQTGLSLNDVVRLNQNFL